MTNKTEMVSEFAALTYKELAERLAHYLSSALVSAQYSMTDETMHDALGLCDQVTRRKYAPSEDVRAGNTASRIRAAVIADAGQEGVSIAEGRFGRELAALCVSIDAEDVRAVVEEPVAWAVSWADDGSFYKLLQDKERAHKFLVDSDFVVLPLYRHPQRPVVLPKFNDWYAKNIGVLGTASAKHDESVWRACLDAFEELNKCQK